MADLKNRRPLGSRDTGWARRITERLAASNVTPNQISAASVAFAALAGLCFAGVAWTDGIASALLLIVAGLGVQLRLLCNLFDGMVAVEAGKGDVTGPFWNEVPDRPADMLILVGFGIGAGAAWLGWTAAALAVFIAYLRAFGSSLGQEADYRGPMAKQHRMASVTIGAVAAIIFSGWIDVSTTLHIVLWIVILGSVLTAYRRALAILAALSASE